MGAASIGENPERNARVKVVTSFGKDRAEGTYVKGTFSLEVTLKEVM